jgi:hypothetical protein
LVIAAIALCLKINDISTFIVGETLIEKGGWKISTNIEQTITDNRPYLSHIVDREYLTKPSNASSKMRIIIDDTHFSTNTDVTDFNVDTQTTLSTSRVHNLSLFLKKLSLSSSFLETLDPTFKYVIVDDIVKDNESWKASKTIYLDSSMNLASSWIRVDIDEINKNTIQTLIHEVVHDLDNDLLQAYFLARLLLDDNTPPTDKPATMINYLTTHQLALKKLLDIRHWRFLLRSGIPGIVTTYFEPRELGTEAMDAIVLGHVNPEEQVKILGILEYSKPGIGSNEFLQAVSRIRKYEEGLNDDPDNHNLNGQNRRQARVAINLFRHHKRNGTLTYDPRIPQITAEYAAARRNFTDSSSRFTPINLKPTSLDYEFEQVEK